MFNSRHKLLIFDFDGTLGDSKEFYRKQIFLNLKKYRYKINKKKFNENFGLRLDRMLRVLHIHKHAKQITKSINDYAFENAGKIKATPGISVLRLLRKKYKLALVSNSRKKFIVKCLKNLRVYDNFDYVLGGDEIISKVKAFKHLFKILRIKPVEAIYIADRAGDVVVAKQSKCDMISVSNRYSWSPLSEIKKATPDKIINNLNQLEKILL